MADILYVYKDNIVLTLMGLILGSGFGIVLSYVVVRIIETGANRYVRTPNIPACLYGSRYLLNCLQL